MGSTGRVLTDRRRRTLSELAEVVCPPYVLAAWDRDALLDEVDRYLASVPPHARRPVLLAVDVFAASARVAALRGIRPHRHFERWWSSPLAARRAVAKALKLLVVLVAFEHPAVSERIGYDGPDWVDRRRRAWLAEHADDARRHRELLLSPAPLPREADR